MEELREKMELEGDNVLNYFASNKLVTNPSKTVVIVFRPTLNDLVVSPISITLAGENVTESQETKLLGVYVTNDLKWKYQVDKLINDLNYSISVLWRLRSALGNKEMKMIAEGLVMSKLRYCIATYGVEFVRVNENDPTHNLLDRLQLIQNTVLRIITGHRRSEHVRISDMLKKTGLLSVNQMIAYSCLMEAWKAKTFNVPILKSVFDRERKDSRILRSDTNNIVTYKSNEAFARNSSKLWNLASTRFKNTNLTIVAKNEAKKLVNSLPL